MLIALPFLENSRQVVEIDCSMCPDDLPRVRNRRAVIDRPLDNCRIVTTFMYSIEIWSWVAHVAYPVVGHNTGISIAQQLLSKQVCTMIWFVASSVLGLEDKSSDLPRCTRTMDVAFPASYSKFS